MPLSMPCTSIYLLRNFLYSLNNCLTSLILFLMSEILGAALLVKSIITFIVAISHTLQEIQTVTMIPTPKYAIA